MPTRLVALLTPAGENSGRIGGIWCLRPHTTRLQMTPSCSISHCTSSPRCGDRDTMAANPPALSPVRGVLVFPLCAPQPFPYLKKHRGFPKKPHASGGSRQQDVPGDQCDKAGGTQVSAASLGER